MDRRTTGLAAGAAVLALSSLAGTAPPATSGSFAPQTEIEVGAVRVVDPLAPGVVVNPKLVTDRSGSSTIVWERDSRIKAARSLAEGGWGPVVDLGPGRAPDSAVDRRGTVTVAWRTTGGRHLVARRWSGGAWRPADTLTGPSGASFVHVWPYRVATNPAGDTIVVWARGYGADPGWYRTRLETAYRPHGGDFGPAVEIERRKAAPFAVFLHRGGAATLAYVDHDSSMIRERTTDGTWGPALVLNGHVGGAAADVDGRLLLAVLDGRALTVQERQPDVGWLAPVDVAPVARQRGVAPVTMNESGGAAIAFTHRGQRLHVADRSSDSPWSSPVVVSPPGQRAAEVQLAIGPDGSLAAAWVDSAADNPRVWVAGRLPGLDWSEAVALTGPRSRSLYYLDLDLDAAGDAIVTWADRLAGQRGRRVVTRTVELGTG